MFTPDVIYNIPTQIVQFTLLVRNSGNTTATNCRLEYDPPEKLTPIQNWVTKGTFLPNQSKWYIGTLKPNEEARITIDFLVTDATESISFPYEIVSNEADANFDTNEGIDELQFVSQSEIYKKLLVKVSKEEIEEFFEVVEEYENTIGDYEIDRDGDVHVIALNDIPSDANNKLIVFIGNSDGLGAPARLKSVGFMANLAGFTIENNESEIQETLYAAFIELRYYP